MANQSKKSDVKKREVSRERVAEISKSKVEGIVVVFFLMWCWNEPSGANVTRRTQKEPNDNGIGRGRIRHTPKGENSTEAVGGADPPWNPS